MRIFSKFMTLAMVAGSTLVAGQAFADTCHLDGTWRLKQDNGYTVTLNMQQDPDGNLSGTAFTRGMGGEANLSGKVFDYSSFKFTVHWVNGAIGVYRGSVKESNFAKGTTNGVRWHSLDTFQCD
jgi:hypothetical protein